MRSHLKSHQICDWYKVQQLLQFLLHARSKHLATLGPVRLWNSQTKRSSVTNEQISLIRCRLVHSIVKNSYEYRRLWHMLSGSLWMPIEHHRKILYAMLHFADHVDNDEYKLWYLSNIGVTVAFVVSKFQNVQEELRRKKQIEERKAVFKSKDYGKARAFQDPALAYNIKQSKERTSSL